MKKFGLVLVAMVAALSLGSCSKKDSGSSSSVDMTGKVFELKEGFTTTTVTFVDGKNLEIKSGFQKMEFPYTVSGNVIKVKADGQDGKFVYEDGKLIDKTNADEEVVFTEVKSDKDDKKASSKKASDDDEDDDDDDDYDEDDLAEGMKNAIRGALQDELDDYDFDF
ncbi:hypothetical protein HNP77_001159 [Treponema rectale]|uniref:Lipoprotein n=1 Tax=Treponema rectale TaxID=744512 RepID=A0A840SDI7_9SPIR|nr:hypothetical protein [Treponema rectale]MBB5218790.1 hypothetical protein [Treponema rectale]